MPEDRVTITADASQYFDVLRRAGVASDSFSRSGDRIGAGFIRGERVVRTATANIAQGLLTVQSATDAAIIAAGSLERVFKIGIGPTIAVAGAVAAFALFKRKLDESETAYKTLAAELRRPLSAEISLDPSDLVTRIDAVHKATDAADKSAKDWSANLARVALDPRLLAQVGQLFLPTKLPPFLLPTTGPHGTKDLQEEANRGRQREAELSRAQADAELRISNQKLSALGIDKEDADLLTAEVELERKRGLLIEESVIKGGNTLNFYKRFLALQIDVEIAARKKAEADKKTLDTAKATTAELEKQAKLAADAASKTPGQQASERRQVRSENKREKELKDELSREGDPEKRADIRDQLAEIQQAREDRAKQQAEKEAAAQAAAQAAADAQAKQQATEQQQARENADRQQKAQDRGELLKFGRILSPDERFRQNIADQENQRQKSFQDQTDKEQQDFRDRGEAEARGISIDQLKRERDFNQSKGKDTNTDDPMMALGDAAKDASEGLKHFGEVDNSVADDFVRMSEGLTGVNTQLGVLAEMDFRGLLPLSGLSISIQ